MQDNRYWYKQYLADRILSIINNNDDEKLDEPEAKIIKDRVIDIFEKLTPSGVWTKTYNQLLREVIGKLYEEYKKEKEFLFFPTISYQLNHH